MVLMSESLIYYYSMHFLIMMEIMPITKKISTQQNWSKISKKLFNLDVWGLLLTAQTHNKIYKQRHNVIYATKCLKSKITLAGIKQLSIKKKKNLKFIVV